MLGAAAGHPAVAVPDDAPAGGLEATGDDLRCRIALQARVRDHPDRRRPLDRLKRRHLRPGVEADAVVVEVAAVERDAALCPELAQHGQAFLEQRPSSDVVEPQRLELTPNALLGLAPPRTEDRPPT